MCMQDFPMSHYPKMTQLGHIASPTYFQPNHSHLVSATNTHIKYPHHNSTLPRYALCHGRCHGDCSYFYLSVVIVTCLYMYTCIKYKNYNVNLFSTLIDVAMVTDMTTSLQPSVVSNLISVDKWGALHIPVSSRLGGPHISLIVFFKMLSFPCQAFHACSRVAKQ